MAAFQTHLGELSDAMAEIIKDADITQHVYFEHGPEAVNSTPEDFCIITYPLTLRDRGPYQVHDVRVEMVCKDMVKSKRTNIHKLEEMVNGYLALFPIKTARHTLSRPFLRVKGGDGLGHSSWTIQCDCMVNTTDAID